jgi:amino acid adenylation domain-containing protein/non-ribosomal peptide synthase protein (TIGR01720 family)
MTIAKIDDVRLSPQQRRLWLLGKTSDAYICVAAVRLSGPLKIEALVKGLRDLIGRHEILRTTFQYSDLTNQVVQSVTDPVIRPLDQIDISEMTPQEQRAEIESLWRLERGRAFCHDHGVILRPTLVVLAADAHVLLLSLPSLCADARAMRNLVCELAVCYGGCLRGEKRHDDHIQYPDVSEVLNQLIEADDTKRGRDHWSEHGVYRFLGAKLPSENHDTEGGRFDAQSLELPISTRIASEIQVLVSKHGASMAGFFLTCWRTLIWRLTAQADLVIGVGYDGRTYSGLEEAVGPFARYLPFSAHLDNDEEFLPVLASVEKAVSDAAQWQDYFCWDLISIESSKNESPAFFQVAFDFQEDLERHFGGKVSFAVFKQFDCPDRFKLRLSCFRKNDAVEASLDYDSASLSGEAAERIGGEFVALVESVLENPNSSVGEFDILSTAEKRQLLVDFNQTYADYSLVPNIVRLITQRAETSPDSVAAVFEHQSLTYGELNKRANELAHFLKRLEAGAEELIAISMPRTLETVIGVLGILKAGAAYVPMDLSYPDERKAFILRDGRIRILLTLKRVAASDYDTNVQSVCLDTQWDVIEQESAADPAVELPATSLAYVIYTSGSTGTPKGVMVEHSQLINYTRAILDRTNIDQSSSFAMVQPLSVDSCITAVFPTLCVGGCLHIISEEMALNPVALAQYFSQSEIDCLKIAPTHLAAMQVYGAAGVMPRSHLIIGGEASRWDWVKTLRLSSRNTLVFNHYGPTETTVGVLTYPVEDVTQQGYSVTPLGYPLANTQAYILDRYMQPVPIGVPGELYIGGANVSRGYLNHVALTAAKYRPDPFGGVKGARVYQTGDSSRHCEDGIVEYLGRLDDQIKIRGFRIEIGEIEARLCEHHSVREVVVVAVNREGGGGHLVAYIVAASPSSLTANDLRSFLKTWVPDYMIPSAFVFLKSLPRTPHGKLDLQALPVLKQIEDDGLGVARTAMEGMMAAIWARILGVKRVGIHDNFFDLGGDSILAIRIVARLHEAGIQSTAQQLFLHQTVAELALAAGPTLGIEVGHSQDTVAGNVPLTPIQKRMFTMDVVDPHHFNQAMLFEVQQDIDPPLLNAAIQSLVRHHDALRLRMFRYTNGWRQVNTSDEQAVYLKQIDLTGVKDEAQGDSIEAAATKIQESLDLSEGPLLKAALFVLGEGNENRLLIVIHHLAVDIVSWHILLEDLGIAYEQLKAGEEVRVGRKTTSFKYWAQRLTDYGESEDVASEMEYWLRKGNKKTEGMPRDMEDGENTEGSARTLTVTLNEEETEALLREVPKAYHTQISEVLLAALARGYQKWSGQGRLLVDLEGHGREGLFEEVDLTRTVGWFTTIYPIVLEVEEGEEGQETLKRVKGEVRGIPKGGIGYGLLRYVKGAETGKELRAQRQAEIIFNYGGQVDQALGDGSVFRLAKESSGRPRSPRADRGYLIQLNGFVVGGRLTLFWSYSENKHTQSSIERLGEEVIASLRSLIAHCRPIESGGYTSSHFPSLTFNQAELEDLVEELVGSGQEGE